MENNFNTAQTFECPGFVTIGDQVLDAGFLMRKPRNNGFKERVCPIMQQLFIHLGIHLGSEKMIETAKEFGLGSVTGINSREYRNTRTASKATERMTEVLQTLQLDRENIDYSSAGRKHCRDDS